MSQGADQCMPQQAEECPIAKVEFEEAKVLADLGSIFQDLSTTLEICSRLKKLLSEDSSDYVFIESFWTTALTKYARCFASGKRFGLSEEIFEKLEGEPLKVHQLYINLRNKHIAHSVNPFEQVVVGLVLSPQNASEKEVIGVSTLAGRHITADIEGVHQLGCLSKVLLEQVCDIAKEYEEKVLEIGKKMSIEELYETARPRFTAPGPDLAGRPRT